MRDNRTQTSWSSTNKRTQSVPAGFPTPKLHLWHGMTASTVQHHYTISRINRGFSRVIVECHLSHVVTSMSKQEFWLWKAETSLYYKTSVPLNMYKTQQLKTMTTALILGQPASECLSETFKTEYIGNYNKTLCLKIPSSSPPSKCRSKNITNKS